MSHVTKVIGVLIAVIALSAFANAQDMRNMSILTGPDGGTYHRFGEDIAEVVKEECGEALKVRPSQGSLDNLGRLRSQPFTQMAIVQQDVLDYVRQNQNRNATIKGWIGKFKYILPLYHEEVHIVVRQGAGLRTLADLSSKRIAVGERGSGTNLTATLILLRARLAGSIEEVHIGAREGILRLLGLEAGAPVDAVFYVAGQPVPLLTGTDKRITEQHLAQLSLVTVPRDHASKRYSPAEFTRETYPWLDRTVATVAVRAVLIAYDFKGRQCDNVAMVARLIKENLEELKRFGHGKWRDVDPDAPVAGWSRYGCVDKGMIAPIYGCRFRKAADRDRPAIRPSASTDCGHVCDVREKQRNPLLCMLCQDKQDLLQQRR